ncbi:CHAP domain-containing protein [Streptococcus ovis]|uniref:CHAP domain-containing protein n=1 Tax=Streptococcus ovis TaxID=82806 RepID=UPI0003737C77|nr:CHAP domain-containing protein [Streptococcus ovis]
MVTAKEVVAYSTSLVGKKVKVPTNPYGGQCIALIDHIVQHFTNGEKNLAYTNAKDGLGKAKSQGLEVVYNDTNNPNLIPQEGDFFVCRWDSSDEFGHIGIVVSADVNGMHTIEQNIDGWLDENGDGINDQLQVGGGGYTRKHYRNYQGVIGWFRLPYTTSTKESAEAEKEVKSLGGTIMFVVKLMEDHDNKNKKGDFFLFNVLNKKYIHVSPAQYALIAPLITAGAIPEVKSYKVAPHFTAIVTKGKFAPGTWDQVYNGK